jgi:hypothetical protein
MIEHLQTYFLEQIRNKFTLLTRVRFTVIGYFSIIIFSNCLLTIITPWYYNWLESSLNCFVSVGVLVILCGILYPRKNVFFCNAEDFQIFAQIQSLVDQHIDGGNNDGVSLEQLNEVPWDLSKVVYVVWPSLADMKKSEQIVVKNTFGDSDEENSIENEKNETPNSSPFSLSVGYEEVFYFNEATKLNEKLL